MDGNIPKAPSYGVYTSQLVRYCYINNTYEGFVKDAKELTLKLHSQGFELNALKHKFSNFLDKYYFIWTKYGVLINLNVLGISW